MRHIREVLIGRGNRLRIRLRTPPVASPAPAPENGVDAAAAEAASKLPR
jgi:hypothetical protein